jgi:phospholipid/cholesterol/gamma-HCH transport system substrate-binding protein
MNSGGSWKVVTRQGLRRLAVAAVVAAILVSVVIIQRASSPASYILRIPTEDASGITTGSDVTIAGVNAGTVRGVALGPEGRALITASIDPAFAPVHVDATADLRPKSLLGEMYLDISPGTSGPVLPSGATLPALQVNRSTDLQQVLNLFNQPTRAKLQTLIDGLGGGLAGRAQQVNDAIPAGRQDISDLAAITSTLNARDQELQTVVAALNTVTTELARSDRRQQLGMFIASTQQLMGNLRAQQARLKRAVVAADSALGNLRQGLQGTAPALSGIAGALPATVQEGSAVLTSLGASTSAFLPQLNTAIEGIQWGPSVFGGNDANGYATRIALTLGCGSVSACPQLSLPVSGAAGASGGPSGATGGGNPVTGSGPGQGILGFLLGGSP